MEAAAARLAWPPAGYMYVHAHVTGCAYACAWRCVELRGGGSDLHHVVLRRAARHAVRGLEPGARAREQRVAPRQACRHFREPARIPPKQFGVAQKPTIVLPRQRKKKQKQKNPISERVWDFPLQIQCVCIPHAVHVVYISLYEPQFLRPESDSDFLCVCVQTPHVCWSPAPRQWARAARHVALACDGVRLALLHQAVGSAHVGAVHHVVLLQRHVRAV